MSPSQAPRALVIGSGLAGLEYARTLAAQGWQVEVISAGRVGRDGATHRVHALAPWILLTSPMVRGDGPDLFLRDLKQRGAGYERDGLAEVLASEAHQAVRELVETLNLVPLEGGPTTLPGDEFARGLRCVPRGGGVLLGPLLQACDAAGVSLSGRSLALGITSDGTRATGALLLDRARHEARMAKADIVVLACGGAGAIFPEATVPRWNRGTGLALASAAGVLLHHPEMTQALPVTATPPLFFPTTAALLSGRVRAEGRWLAIAGEMEAFTRAIGEALRRGARVVLEPSGEGAAVLPPRLRESAAFRAEGTVPLTVVLHHGIGGVAIDAWGRTSLPGLYACGEAAGGVQGLRRTMGTGLLEAFVFARRAAHATVNDIRRLGPAAAGGEALIPPLPVDPLALEERLDVLMRPLVVVRPPREVASALHEIREWPSETGEPVDERGLLAAIRRQAAQAMLSGEAAIRKTGIVLGLHQGASASGS